MDVSTCVTCPLYNKTRHSYMFPLAGQTAGSNGLKFCVYTHEKPKGDFG